MLRASWRNKIGPTSTHRMLSTGHATRSMQHNMTVTFLGTNSGGGPTDLRNCSSLVAEVVGDGSLWMVDCAEGTLRQFTLQPTGGKKLALPRLSKIFITHMHADHVMGIVPLLRNVLLPSTFVTTPQERLEIYGPAGLRKFVRSILQMTFTETAHRYVVHELLSPDDEKTLCEPPGVMHPSENAGSDIVADSDSFWRGIVTAKRKRGMSPVIVDAGLIEHRVPSIGYVFSESAPPSRKLVFLGDTSDASSIIPLCISPPPSLVVHEATDTYIPKTVDPYGRKTEEQVLAKVSENGHSTSGMAGEFAKKVGAKMLLLNHISAKFPPVRKAVIGEIERQASEAWGMGKAIAAVDFMQVVIPAATETTEEAEPGISSSSVYGHTTARGMGGRSRRGGRRWQHNSRGFTHRGAVANFSAQDP